VQWVDFLRYADPPPAVQSALKRFHAWLTAAKAEKGLEPLQALAFITQGTVVITIARLRTCLYCMHMLPLQAPAFITQGNVAIKHCMLY
jgi:hypothetical protein